MSPYFIKLKLLSIKICYIIICSTKKNNTNKNNYCKMSLIVRGIQNLEMLKKMMVWGERQLEEI